MTLDAGFGDIPQDLLAAASRVALLILDVDGVMTDGGLYYDADGRMFKRFNVQDGLGIVIAQRAGLRIAVITGMASSAVDSRMKDLGISDYYSGNLDKRASFMDLLQKYALSPEQVAYVGDDWVDMPLMCAVGLPIAVANAQPEVKALGRYCTQAHGGQGAVREVIRLLLHAKGLLHDLAAQWKDGAPRG